jgi:RimJ/RimL family protein N-acetyltransferase
MRFPDDVPVLTDGEVTLRAHTLDDLARVVEQCRDPESLAWTTVPSPYDEADGRDWLTRAIPAAWESDATYAFAIEVDGRFGGTVDLRMKGEGVGELGFGLHPDVRGRHAMRRALDLLLDWGFDDRGLEVVTWQAFVGNWASRRTVWHLGFTFGATVPRLLPHRGERRDAWTAWLGRADERTPTVAWHEPPVLEKDGVRLRPWRDDDRASLVEAGNDPLVREWIPETPLPRSSDDASGYLLFVRLAHAEGRRVGWCVADAATDQPLGSIGVFDFEDSGDDVTAQLGYWSLPAGRGRGSMTTGLRLACDWLLRTRDDGGFGARRLYLLTSVGNTASRRLAERSGFEHVGTERQSGPDSGGGWADSALYDRLR